jgi:site-specific DNA-methyltransferase (adenine-specific)
MINKGLMSSNTDEWATPQLFYEELNKKYNFNLDPCSTDNNHKCKKYFTKKDNGLLQSWSGYRVYCNPPYGREIGKWVEKAYNENKNGTFIVMLLPARTDTKWFHNFIYKQHKIEFIKGRLKFNDGKNSAPFPSMIVIMKGK